MDHRRSDVLVEAAAVANGLEELQEGIRTLKQDMIVFFGLSGPPNSLVDWRQVT